jgi:hypothetical protein
MPKESKALGRTASLASMPPEEAKALGKTDSSSSSKKASNALGPTASLAAMSPEEAKALKGGRGKKSRKTKRMTLKKMRSWLRLGGATPAKTVADAVISQLEPHSEEVAEGIEGDETVTLTLPVTDENAAGIDELIRRLDEYKSGTVKGQVMGALSGVTGKIGSFFAKKGGAVTELLVPALTSLKTSGTASITTTPTGFSEIVDRLGKVTESSGGKSKKKTRRYSRRR